MGRDFSIRFFSFSSGSDLFSLNSCSNTYNGRMMSTIFMLKPGSMLLPAASTNFCRTCALQTCYCGFGASGRCFIQHSYPPYPLLRMAPSHTLPSHCIPWRNKLVKGVGAAAVLPAVECGAVIGTAHGPHITICLV